VQDDVKWLLAFHQLDFLFGPLEYLRDNGAGLLGGQGHADETQEPPPSAVYYKEGAPLGLSSVPLTKAWRMPTFIVVLALILLHAGLGATMLAAPSSKQVKQQRSTMRWLHHVLVRTANCHICTLFRNHFHDRLFVPLTPGLADRVAFSDCRC